MGLEGDLVKLRFGAVHLHYEAVTRITSDNVEKNAWHIVDAQ